MTSHETRRLRENPQPQELTLRAALTGMLIGALLTPCNIYSGLKIGWSFNMSIAAAILGVGFWRQYERFFKPKSQWSILESNISQTSASAAASIVSSGFAAPIPALALLTDQYLSYVELVIWTCAVSFIGVCVALLLRHQFIAVDKLAFPSGVATGVTVKELFSKGLEAAYRLKALLGATFVAGGVKLLELFSLVLPKPTLFSTTLGEASAKNLGLFLDPSLMMVGFGGIIGIRVGISLLLGGILAWVILAPMVVSGQWVPVNPTNQEAVLFGSLVEWLLWPGVTLMLVSSLSMFALSAKQWALPVFRLLRRVSRSIIHVDKWKQARQEGRNVGILIGTSAALLFAVWAQVHFFGIPVTIGVAACLLTLLLATVSGRVSGETGITPLGAMGKVTQLTMGFLAPQHAAANLMTANITGGASDQCADLLHDFKTGSMLGASPHRQTIAQIAGVIAGALAGSLTYLVLVPDPKAMLITPEWPAPAVATWKAVAEVIMAGFETFPLHATKACMVAAVVGVVISLLVKFGSERVRLFIPSAPSMGLAFVIPFWNSLGMFLGSLLAFGLSKAFPAWSHRFVLIIAAGLVAGESLAGVLTSVIQMVLG